MGQIRPSAPASMERFKRNSSEEAVLNDARAELSYLLHDFWAEQETKERKGNG
jgi:hypothetical protein